VKLGRNGCTAGVVDADMPSYKILIALVGYLACARPDRGVPTHGGVPRPHVSIARAIAVIVMHVAIGVAVSALVSWWPGVPMNRTLPAVSAIAYWLAVITVSKSRIVLWLIRLYQARAPEEIRAKCVMTPRCSVYMSMAIEKYGLRRGVAVGVDRLRRCCPPPQVDYP